MSLIREIKKFILANIRGALEDVHTTIPAQVVSYNADKNTCSIQPCIARFRVDDTDTGAVQLPQIDDIPVHFSGSGTVLITTPVKTDDSGVYHISEDDISQWLSEGGQVDPSSIERFNLNDGFFVPANMFNFSTGFGTVATDRVSIRTKAGTTEISVLEDGNVEINTTGSVKVNGDSDAAALASKVDDFISTFDTVVRTTWVPVAQDGGALFQTTYKAAFLTEPTTVESEVLKVGS